MVARVALGGPPASLAPQPSAPAPTHRSAPRRPPPYAPQIDRRPSPLSRARRPRAAPSRPACRPAPPRGASSPRLLRPGGRVALESVAIRWVCPVGSPVRRPLSSILGVGRSRLGRGRPLAFGSVGPAIPSCTEDSVDSAMPRSLELGIKTVDTFSAPHLGGPYKVRRERQGQLQLRCYGKWLGRRGPLQPLAPLLARDPSRQPRRAHLARVRARARARAAALAPAARVVRLPLG